MTTASGHALGYHSIILELASLHNITTKIDIVTIQIHDSLAGGFVMTILGNDVHQTRQVRLLFPNAALLTMGGEGFEPATYSV